MCCHWPSFTSLGFISFPLPFLTLNLWGKTQGAEELCALLLSPNRNASYTKFAEEHQPPSFKKPQARYGDTAPSSKNPETSKIANSATQFKVGNELVPAELCQRTSRSLKTSKEMSSIQVLPLSPLSAQVQKNRVHLLPQPQHSSGSSRSKIFETPQAMKGSTIKWGSSFYNTGKSKGSFA